MTAKELLEQECPELIRMQGILNGREYDYDIPKELFVLHEKISLKMQGLLNERDISMKLLKQASPYLQKAVADGFGMDCVIPISRVANNVIDFIESKEAQ